MNRPFDMVSLHRRTDVSCSQDLYTLAFLAELGNIRKLEKRYALPAQDPDGMNCMFT